ncbi:MAG: type IV secretory system conjugative DNA transfer family protein [Phycicoccus sp.]
MLLQRARAVPWAVAAAVAAAGMCGWVLAVGAARSGQPIAPIAAAAAAVTLLGGATAAVTRRARLRPWARTWVVATSGAAAWVAWTTMSGPTWAGAAAIATAAVALSWRWMATHPVPVTAVHDTSPADQGGSPVERFAAHWHTSKAARGVLTDGAEHDNRVSYTLRCGPGETLATYHAAQLAIASTLDMDPMQLTFSPVDRDAAGWQSAGRIRLQVVARSPITDVVPYTQPRWSWSGEQGRRTGRVGLGPYVDGTGYAEWELYRARGVFSGVVIGSTGGGKSSTVNTIVAGARASGCVVTVYCDPKGNSSPDLAAAATVTCLGLDQAEELTSAVELLVARLGDQQAADGLAGYEPSPERPTYLVVVDESDMLFALPGMGDRWGRIAKMGRAVGVALMGATQYAGQMAFGGSELLRSSFAAGNVVLLRTESNTSDNLIAPHMPRSTTLPRAPGYQYVSNSTAQPIAVRAEWLLTSDEATGKYADRVHSGAVFAVHPDAPLCAIGRRALSPLLTAGTGTERETARRAETRARLNSWLAGDTPGTPREGQAGDVQGTSGGTARGHQGGQGVVSQLAPVPVLRPAAAAAPSPNSASSAAPRPDLAASAQLAAHASSDDVVHRALWRAYPDPATRRHIVTATGLPDSTVRDALARLTDSGRVRRAARGAYTAVPVARESTG